MIIASSASMSGPIASTAVELHYKWGYSIQVKYAGSVTNGQVYLQASNDGLTANGAYNVNPTATFPGVMTPITGTTALVSGTSGSIVYDSQFANYRWVQLVYVPSSAVATSGILTATSNVKGP